MSHTDPFPESAPGSHRMRGVGVKQGDGRKPLPHIITALLSIGATLLLGHFSAILQGQQGPAGLTTVITKPVVSPDGLCVYVGSGSSITQRVQITSPKMDAAGPYCLKGSLVSVVPVKAGGKR